MAQNTLGDWIKANMTVDEMSVLDAHKETIARFVGVTKDGRIILLKDKSQMDAQQMVVLYLIGKYMARLAEYTDVETARNIEIAGALGIPKGTVGRCLRELEAQGLASKSDGGGYRIILSALATFFASMGDL